MLQLITIATFLFTHFTTVAALAVPITHPLPLRYTPGTHSTLSAPPIGTGEAGEAVRVFATRAESSGSLSAGAIGGIVAGVILGIPLIIFIIAKARQSSQRSTAGQPGFLRPQFASKSPTYPQAHPYGAQLVPPPPAYNHPVQFQQQQQHFYPSAPGGQVQMPQTVHLGSGGSFYAPAAQPQHAQEEERGVRFGPVGVRRYGQ